MFGGDQDQNYAVLKISPLLFNLLTALDEYIRPKTIAACLSESETTVSEIEKLIRDGEVRVT